MPATALIILVCGLAATWLAAGSLGWIAPPLQKVLTWLALSSIVLIALQRCGLAARWALAVAAVAAVLLTASALTAVNIMAVAMLLASVAFVRRGMIAQVAGPTALASATLAMSRLLIEGTASGWSLADAVGRAEGHWAATLTGRPLIIGASFGGVDFLIVMAALAVAWHRAAPQPNVKRLVAAGLAIVAAQTVYLVVLAYGHDIDSMLPLRTRAVTSDSSHLGLWTWSNAMHAMLPWHLPVLAMIAQTAIAVIMFRSVSWPVSSEETAPDKSSTEKTITEKTREAANVKRRDRRMVDKPLENARSIRPQAVWLRLVPAGLLVVAAAAVGVAPVKPDLAGRRVVAYDDGTIDWTTSNPGNISPGLSPRYGLLPALVASLGGEFVVSKDLNAGDLRDASVLIVLPPGTPPKPGATASEISIEIRQNIWNFVKSGGGLIVAGDPETRLDVGDNALNALLEPTGMSFRDDTANSLTERWESNLLAAPHAVNATGRPGQGCFSIQRTASVQTAWPAAPLLTGRWCWNELGSDPIRGEALAYAPGNRLGDLVLAAHRNFGQGNVVALGDATCLSNDGLPFSYTFCGPLLASLADSGTTPLAWWRQLIAFAAAGAAVVLLFRFFDPLSLAAAVLVMATAVIACERLNDSMTQLLPSAAKPGQRPVIYVDGSHLEAMGKDPWRDDGIGQFMRVLAESNYLPLLAPDLSPARLAGAKMVISIAPGRQFTRDEIDVVNAYVERGGNFLCMAGSPNAEPSRPLSEKLNLQIAPMPLPPWINSPETEPLGAMAHEFVVPPDAAQLPAGQNLLMRFHSAWPVAAIGMAGGTTWPSNPVVIAGNGIEKGQAFLLGDSQFALQKGLNPPSAAGDPVPQNSLFWQTTLRSWLRRPAD